MNEENKVELDTDDVQEENVSVQEQPKDEKPEQVEVDLGYKDPVKQETKAKIVTTEETPEPQTEDNLPEHTQNVQKRIDQLTRKMREAERREKAALDFATKVKKENDELSSKMSTTEKSLNEQYSGKIESQLNEAKRAYKLAYDEGNTDAMADASALIAKLSVEEENAKKEKAKLESVKEVEVEDPQKAVNKAVEKAPVPDAKSVEWASRNPWFGKKKGMTFTAYEFHRTLTEEEGYDATSDEYYAEIDRRMREEFPASMFEESNSGTTRPNAQTVAPATRNKKSGRNTVRLTKSQVAIAKKLGVPLEEYAKHVKEPN